MKPKVGRLYQVKSGKFIYIYSAGLYLPPRLSYNYKGGLISLSEKKCKEEFNFNPKGECEYYPELNLKSDITTEVLAKFVFK